MDIPQHHKIYEHSIATFWFDENNILHAVSKGGPRTIEIMDDYIVFVKNMVENKQVCILTDISKATPMDKKNTRLYSHSISKSV